MLFFVVTIIGGDMSPLEVSPKFLIIPSVHLLYPAKSFGDWPKLLAGTSPRQKGE